MMKKTLSIVCSLLLIATAANAQNLLNALQKAANSSSVSDAVSSVVSDITSASSSVDLTGTWTYSGVAASVKSDNILTTVAGNAAVSTVEKKVDNILAKAGIQSGSASFTFSIDGSFVMTTANSLKFSGTWTQTDAAVTLKFGKALTYLQLDGTVSGTSNSCEVLFDGQKFLAFAQKVVSAANKITTSSGIAGISSVLSTAKNVDAGFSLKK